MKSSTITVLIISLASAALAASVPMVQARAEHAKKGIFGGNGSNGIFGQRDNLVSNIFDGAACIVSSVIGGGNPRCQGKGTATTKDGVSYNYTYSTNQDGPLHVTITLEDGGSCTYNLKADGKRIQDIIDQAAEGCSKVK